jgi:hypothetical protein
VRRPSGSTHQLHRVGVQPLREGARQRAAGSGQRAAARGQRREQAIGVLVVRDVAAPRVVLEARCPREPALLVPRALGHGAELHAACQQARTTRHGHEEREALERAPRIGERLRACRTALEFRALAAGRGPQTGERRRVSQRGLVPGIEGLAQVDLVDHEALGRDVPGDQRIAERLRLLRQRIRPGVSRDPAEPGPERRARRTRHRAAR